MSPQPPLLAGFPSTPPTAEDGFELGRLTNPPGSRRTLTKCLRHYVRCLSVFVGRVRPLSTPSSHAPGLQVGRGTYIAGPFKSPRGVHHMDSIFLDSLGSQQFCFTVSRLGWDLLALPPPRILPVQSRRLQLGSGCTLVAVLMLTHQQIIDSTHHCLAGCCTRAR